MENQMETQETGESSSMWGSPITWYIIIALILIVANLIYTGAIQKSSISYIGINVGLCVCCACILCLMLSYSMITFAWICGCLLVLFTITSNIMDMAGSSYANYIDPGKAIMNYLYPVPTQETPPASSKK